MANFKDEELLFLSNLMHIKEELIIVDDVEVKSPFRDIWTDEYANKNKSIGELINKIDTDKLREKPYADYKFNGEISGAEWADMLDAMKTSDICKLRVQDVNRDNKEALISYLKDEEGNTYVVFRGTSSGEWPDNFQGAYLSDTEQQKAALAYINSIDADNITVVGHSKGGNKAKYVALLSDKVTDCVSFDGQGFSQAFKDKYQDLIEKNKYKIKCYALDADFVNILMHDIYKEKYYIKGNGIGNFLENHSPNSFFDFKLRYNEDGERIITSYWTDAKQTEAMVSLHSFVLYVYNAIPESDRKDFFTFLGAICDMKLGHPQEYTTKDLMTFLTASENAHEIGLLIACLIKYEEYDSGITTAVFDILFGETKLLKWLKESGIALKDLVKTFKFTEGITPPSIFTKNFKTMGYFLRMALEVMASVKDVTEASMMEYNPKANDYIRDFTQEKRDKLLSLTMRFANESPVDVYSWDKSYGGEDWYTLLDIRSDQNNINENYTKVIDFNEIRNNQLRKIFSDVDRVSGNYQQKMETEIERLNQLSRSLESLFS
jgi:hypothetical protein